MRRILHLIILLISATAATHASDMAARADSAYNKEDYRQAIRIYHQAIDDQGISPEIYYNLGNAYYRINNLGRAVLYYERALNLDPSMDDARVNLEFVKTRILDKPEDDSSFLTNIHMRTQALMSPNAWAWTAFGMFVLLMSCCAIYIFSGNIALRKTGFFGGIVVLIFTIYSVIIAYQSANALTAGNRAVVIVPTTNMRSAPGQTNDNKVMPIHEGTVVEITDSLTMPGQTVSPKWYDVKINNSTRAWVNAADVEII